jgi:transposase
MPRMSSKICQVQSAWSVQAGVYTLYIPCLVGKIWKVLHLLVRLTLTIKISRHILHYMSKPRKPDPKLAALTESGTANPHPEAVRDAAFVESEFFDPRDLLQVKYEMLRRVRIERQSIAETAARFGLSRPTFYKAQVDFERAGLMGLLPVKRGPRGAHKITGEVMRFIEHARAEDEGLDAQALAERIARRFGRRVHRRTVERALARSKKKRR